MATTDAVDRTTFLAFHWRRVRPAKASGTLPPDHQGLSSGEACRMIARRFAEALDLAVSWAVAEVRRHGIAVAMNGSDNAPGCTRHAGALLFPHSSAG